MDTDGVTPQPEHVQPEDVLPDDMLRLLAGIGAQLREPLSEDRHADVLATVLAAREASAASSPAASSSRASSPGAASVAPGRASGAGARPRGGRASGARAGRWRVTATAGVATLTLIVGASVALLGGGDDLPLIAIGGSAAGPMAGDASAAGGPLRMMEGADAATSMWWTPTRFRFTLADGVGFPAGSGAAWRLVPPADPMAAAGRIATALGMPAPVTSEWDPDSLQSNRPDGASLWFSPSGDWYFSGPYDEALNWICPELPSGTGGPDAPADVSRELGEIDPIGECVPPAPLDGVPDEARARVLATQLLATLGHADVRITSVHVDDWSAWVTAELTAGGVPADSGLNVGVGFGGGERVTSAHGTAASVESLGAYPTIDAAAAIARLEAELSAWLDGGPFARPLPAPADDADTPVSDTPVTILPVPDGLPEGDGRPADGVDGGTVTDAPDGADAPDGTDAPEMPEVVEVSVTIVTVELVTMLSWSPDGTVLLVPHYRLIDRDGGWWFVVAVADRYLAG